MKFQGPVMPMLGLFVLSKFSKLEAVSAENLGASSRPHPRYLSRVLWSDQRVTGITAGRPAAACRSSLTQEGPAT